MQAMILTAPPQAGQVSMSMPNTRLRRCVRPSHGRVALRRGFLHTLLGRFGFAALAPLCRRHQSPMLAVRREHAVESSEIDPWLWHQGALVAILHLR